MKNFLEKVNKCATQNWQDFLFWGVMLNIWFWILCVNVVKPNEILVLKNRLSGQHRIYDQPKMCISGPWPFVSAGQISTLPQLIEFKSTNINSASNSLTSIYFPSRMIRLKIPFTHDALMEYIKFNGDPTNMLNCVDMTQSSNLKAAIFSGNFPNFIELIEPEKTK